MDRLNYKRFFLLALIGALVLSALVGIYIFLIGDFGDMENKILFTTISLAVFSLLGLCSALVHGNKNLSLFSILGMGFSLSGFIASLEIIWQINPSPRVAEIFMLLAILSFAFAHIFIIRPILRRKVEAMVINEAQALAHSRQREHDHAAEAGGFADALGVDVGAGF